MCDKHILGPEGLARRTHSRRRQLWYQGAREARIDRFVSRRRWWGQSLKPAVSNHPTYNEGLASLTPGRTFVQDGYAVGQHDIVLSLSLGLLGSGDFVLYRVDNDWLMRDRITFFVLWYGGHFATFG